ncbi:MAG TPA: 3-hydroxyacyl-CoA dehydrogenase NAD-binding domain-containing protein [Candidatus Eremiobacteraceae bacterium]|nr:3-hydroxyacyl-CoA dehydrogenase NAD-binding domain-containing protein [Candidatus Eremiobacteraceae bacterium]
MTIARTAVVGAGTMGIGIAHSLATGGFDVVLVDALPAALDRAVASIEKNLQAGVQRGKLQADAARDARAHISTAPNLAAAARAQLVIEAVPEDLAIKHSIFEQLEAVCAPETVFATNTSALSITEIAAGLSDPSRLVGMHYFNPAHIMKLIEIVRGLETADRCLHAAREVAERCGKETVLINEAPGFATSRINAMIGNEAFYMLMEGVASARDIDKALKLGLNHPMGPFEMIDLVGLDTRLRVLEYLHSALGEKFRPCPLLVKYVKAGRLGRKVGRGVYDYPEELEALEAAKNRSAPSVNMA